MMVRCDIATTYVLVAIATYVRMCNFIITTRYVGKVWQVKMDALDSIDLKYRDLNCLSPLIPL